MTDIRKDFLEASRPLAQDLIDFALKSGKTYGITDVEVNVFRRDQMETELEEGKISKSVTGSTSSVGVTLYAGDRTLSFRRNTLDSGILKDAMTDNMKVIHLVPETPKKRLLEPQSVFKGPTADLDLFDTNPPSNADMIAFARKVEQAAVTHPGVYKVEGTSISRDIEQSLTLATNGLDHATAETVFSTGVSVIARDSGGKMENDGEYAAARHFSDLGNPQKIGKAGAEKTVARLGAKLPNTGDMPVVLNNQAAATLFSSVFSAIRGTTINRDASFMKGKIGQQVLNAGVTIVDQPGIQRGLGSGQTDSAGQEMKDIVFVENGILKSYNLDLLEARQLGLPPIGRDGTGAVTNARVLPGAPTPEALITAAGDGIYIEGFHGGQANVNTGIFSRQAHGRMIRNGKITDEPVAGFVVSGNLKDMFMDVALANDTPPQPNTRYTLAAPTTLIRKVTIAGE